VEVTPKTPVPPLTFPVARGGERATTHAAEVWVIRIALSLIRIVPDRWLPEILAVTENATAPFPLPVAPLVIVIHGESEVAVRSHPVAP
jgi:hypothetical protein